jgi:hypothetical protein
MQQSDFFEMEAKAQWTVGWNIDSRSQVRSDCDLYPVVMMSGKNQAISAIIVEANNQNRTFYKSA